MLRMAFVSHAVKGDFVTDLSRQNIRMAPCMGETETHSQASIFGS